MLVHSFKNPKGNLIENIIADTVRPYYNDQPGIEYINGEYKVTNNKVSGETKEITTIFRGKTSHGLVEASAPIVIEHKSETDISKINSMIEAIKAGKSLKSIELNKSDYKVEGE